MQGGYVGVAMAVTSTGFCLILRFDPFGAISSPDRPLATVGDPLSVVNRHGPRDRSLLPALTYYVVNLTYAVCPFFLIHIFTSHSQPMSQRGGEGYRLCEG